MERTLDCVQRALDDSGLAATQVGRVVLVGGSTRTPLVGRLLEERLGQPVHREVHPDLCVALGAAVQAAIVGKQNVGAVLVDITPHSLGIKTLEYPDDFGERVNEFKFTPIVSRNAPLPATRSEVFCTVSDGQPTVEIDLYQGESGDVRRNHRVGKFLVEGLARVPAGNQIVVQLDLTLDGTLKVSAREKSTGLLKQITIENAMARFALEEREAARARLDRLWDDSAGGGESESDESDDELGEHPKPRFKLPAPPPAPEPGEGQREAVQARALLEKAARLRSAAAEEDRAELDRLTGKIQAALAERQWQRLTQAMHELTDVLFYLEDS